MHILSEEEQSDIEACSSEYMKIAEVSEELRDRMKAALDAHGHFFERAEISWEISQPIHRDLGAPLIKRGEKVYSGEHLLYETSKLSAQDEAFIRYVLDKSQVSVI